MDRKEVEERQNVSVPEPKPKEKAKKILKVAVINELKPSIPPVPRLVMGNHQ